MDDTQDYLEEATPSAHHESHEDEGTDEMSLAGLALDPADITLDTTDFDGILSGADDNPQKALDTVDDHGHAQLHDQNKDQYLDSGGSYTTHCSEVFEAVDKKHPEGNDQSLDGLGPNAVNVVEVKSAVDLKHAQAHDITSHTDIADATGAQIEELTGGGETTLHTHAGLAGGPCSYRIATGESVTIDAYEQFLLYGQYVIEGSGELTIDSTGQLAVIGA